MTITGLVVLYSAKGIELTTGSGSSLTQFPAGVSRFTDYVAITLNSNMIASIPVGVFKNSINTVRISLSSNQLTSLPSGVLNFPLATDISVSLDNNPISSIEAGFFQGTVHSKI